jgi:hypothetical protein
MAPSAMDSAVTAPPFSLMMIPGYVSDIPKTLEIHCQDRIFNDVSSFDTTKRKELFRVKRKGPMSWSWRRSLIDVQGKHVLDSEHYSLDVKNRWIAETPEGRKLATVEHKSQITKEHSSVNAVFLGAYAGDDITVEMRPADRSALTTAISVRGIALAEIWKTGDNDIAFN